jgi:tetratricopeptide (TPR) repeat protein
MARLILTATSRGGRLGRACAALLVGALGALALSASRPRLALADDTAHGSVDLDDERTVARAHFEAGRKYQDGHVYDRAIIEYQAAYAIEPMPELLYNIGQCYRLAGEPRSAVLYYQRYLQLVSDGGATEEARAHVSALRKSIAANPKVAGVAIATPGLLAEEQPAPPDQWRWFGAGSVVTGLALGGLGLAMGSDDAGDDTEALALTGVGVALVAAGGVTWYLATRTSTPRRLVAAPVAGPGVAGVALAGSF